MPGQPLNLNSARTGSRLARLTIGELPKPLKWLQRQVCQYRRGLEDVALEVHGEVSPMIAHEIDTAVQGQIHAGICRWILNTKFGKLTPQEIMKCSREMLAAKERRNKAVEAMDIEKDRLDEIDNLYSIPSQTPDIDSEPDSGDVATPKRSSKRKDDK